MRTRALLAAVSLLASSCATQHARLRTPIALPPAPIVATVTAPRDISPALQLLRIETNSLLARTGLGSLATAIQPSIDQLSCNNVETVLCSPARDHDSQMAAIAVARECFRDVDASNRENARGALLRCAVTDDESLRVAIADILIERGILGERAARLIPARRQLAGFPMHYGWQHPAFTGCGLDTPRDDDSVIVTCRTAHRNGCNQDEFAYETFAISAAGPRLLWRADGHRPPAPSHSDPRYVELTSCMRR